jgi:hypothetical protein
MADADPPWAAARDDVAAGVDAEALGRDEARRAGDRPALDVAGRVEAAGGPGGEGAAGEPLEPHALAQHLVDLRAAVGEQELAAVEAADLAVLAVGAEDRVDLAQPGEGRLGVDGLGIPNVDADRDPHDVTDVRH